MRIGDMFAGGPGSGCHGPNCGRPPKDGALYRKDGTPNIRGSEFPLTAKQKMSEARFRTAVAKDPDGTLDRYKAKFGNVLNADNVKELSPDFQKDRTHGAAAVHEPASWLMKKMYAEELAKPAGPGKDNTVFFTAGGAGAGKTTAIDAVPGVQAIQSRAQLVYDGTLRPASSAIKKIDQALAAGKDVHIAYTHRDPEGAFRDGVLGRATRQEKEHGSGRTVMLDEFAHQHSSIQDSMRKVVERYADNPKVHLEVLDNSRGKGNTRASTLDALPKAPSYAELVPRLTKILEDERSAGKISDAIYKATKGVGAKKEIGM